MPAKAKVSTAASVESETAKLVAERQRNLDSAISAITKSFGEGSIMRLGDAGKQMKIDVIPTGALNVDLALGVGGVPRGRIVEIFRAGIFR